MREKRGRRLSPALSSERRLPPHGGNDSSRHPRFTRGQRRTPDGKTRPRSTHSCRPRAAPLRFEKPPKKIDEVVYFTIACKFYGDLFSSFVFAVNFIGAVTDEMI